MQPPQNEFERLQSRAVELAIRLGMLFVLLYWCFILVEPFILMVLWGIIVAIALLPVFRRLSGWLGQRPRLAASALVTSLIAILVVPAVMLTDSLIVSAQSLAKSGDVALMAPPEQVAEWPLVGKRVFDVWQRAATNLPEVLDDFEPQIRAVGSWLLDTVTNTGIGILQFLVSFVIAGILLTTSEKGGVVAEMLARRLVGKRGHEFAELCARTIRNVALGIVGVSIVQTAGLGLGFLVIDLPGAGLLALLALVLCIVQIGPGLVSIPAIIYVFSTADTGPAVLFAIWTLVMTMGDGVLKPLIFSRGATVPAIIIFLGAIGGLLSYGIIGLFLGAVVLSLGYKLYEAWLAETSGLSEAGTENTDSAA
jgi:predicted PurR-regulated permease PerM